MPVPESVSQAGVPHLLVGAVGKLRCVPVRLTPKGSLDGLHQHGFLSIPANSGTFTSGQSHQM